MIILTNGQKIQGANGLAYFTFENNGSITGKGPVGKFFSEESLKEIMKITSATIGDSIFFLVVKKMKLKSYYL